MRAIEAVVEYSAVYTRDSARLVTAGGDGAVRVWNAKTGSIVRELRLNGRAPRWFLVAVSGERVAAIDGDGAHVAAWDIATGKVLAELKLRALKFPSLALSPDGGRLAVSSGDDVHLLDEGAGEPRSRFPAQGFVRSPGTPRDRACSSAAGLGTHPSGVRRATHGWLSAKWARPSRQWRRGGPRFLADADLSPDGSMVVGGGGDGLLRFWDTATGRLLWTLAATNRT